MCFLAPFTSVAQPASTSVRFRSTRPLDEPWVIQDSSNLPWRSPTPRITAQHSYDVAPGSPAPKRKRGRPRSVKEAVLGPKRPRGRPRKLAVDGENEIPLRKRPVGRPPKEKAMRGVQIELGTIVSCLFFLSTLAACSNTEQNMPGAIHRSAAQAVLPAPPPQSHPCPSEQPAHFATPSNHANDSTSGCPSAHLVIPREDPQQEVELDEDELDGVGDGIGEDDEGEDDEDEDEDKDEDDCSGRAAPSSTRKPGRVRHPFLHGFSRPLLLNARTVTQMAFLASIRGIARSGHVKQLRTSTFKAITLPPRLSTAPSSSCGIFRPFTRIFNVPTATTHFTDTPLSHDPDDASGSTHPSGSSVIVTVAADASTPKARSTP